MTFRPSKAKRRVSIQIAQDRIGGRIWTSRIGGTAPVDLGASWIHGIAGNPIARIAAANGIQMLPTNYGNESVHFHDLGMGVLNKTCLLFDDIFWPPEVELIGYVGAQPGQWAEAVSLYPYTQQPILMMFNAGAYAVRTEAMADAEIVSEALAALVDMYGPVPPPKDALVTRWRSDPCSYGSYSYVPVGSSFAQYAELAAPIDGRVFLAGEATHEEYPATMHGLFCPAFAPRGASRPASARPSTPLRSTRWGLRSGPQRSRTAATSPTSPPRRQAEAGGSCPKRLVSRCTCGGHHLPDGAPVGSAVETQ